MHNSSNQRWYDNEPELKEALDLLQLSTDDLKGKASQYILELQSEVSLDIINRIEEVVEKYSQDGSRWYDNDPILMKGIELLKKASSEVRRRAAIRIIQVLTEDHDE